MQKRGVGWWPVFALAMGAMAVIRSPAEERMANLAIGVGGGLALLLIVFLGLWGVSRWRIRRGIAQMDGFFVMPHELSRQRVDAVLPDGPSAELSHLLVAPEADETDPEEDAGADFLPDEQVYWVLTAELDEALDGRSLYARFGRGWHRKLGGVHLFGREEGSERWSFASANDTVLTALKLCWPLHDRDVEESVASLERLGSLRTAAEEFLASLGGRIVSSSATVREAAARSAHLGRCFAELDGVLTIILAAPDGSPFEGRALWDVLEGLGFEWGDGDLFHWHQGLRVWTSTEPGHFLPEAAAAGMLQVVDLRFGFSIPRARDPHVIATAAITAAEQVQQRLGGVLLEDRGRPFDATRARAFVDSTVAALEAEGFTPGSTTTLQLF